MKRRSFLMTAAALPAVHAAAAGAPAATKQQAKGSLRLGVITQISHEPDAGIKRVKDLGFPTCQIYASDLSAAVAKALRASLDRYGLDGTSVIATGPAPEVYDFYKGPQTIGFVPREYRAARIAVIKRASDFAKVAGIPVVQTHCGFIPENPNDPVYAETVAAIREVAEYCKNNGQHFCCETGQETPVTLVRAIKDAGSDALGINLDPANLILYGKANPVDAVDLLGPYIRGVHAKDGLYPTSPKALGQEVAIGKGKVNFPALVKKLKDVGYHGALTIEREIEGAEQQRDILAAKAFLEKLI